MQGGRNDNIDDSVTDSAALTDASRQHHSSDIDAAASYQNIRENNRNEDPEAEDENKKRERGNEKISSGYEALDPREVEEARRRAQQPSEYAQLQWKRPEDYTAH